jgi:hypothetical protein
MKKNVFTASLLICIAFQIFVPEIKAAEVCEWNFRSCPEDINGQVITVPEKVIALSPYIRACNAMTEMVSADTPAIMFVIDNSSSMIYDYQTGVGNDANGERFNVIKELLDTIYKAQPGAFVGLSIFASGLIFDKDSSDLFVGLEGIPDSIDNSKKQAFLSPLKLDSTYNFNNKTMSGIEIIKFLLETETRQQGMGRRGVYLKYNPLNDNTGTNINYGFDGALQGFKMLSEDLISKENRFIVFFSDGKPTGQGHKDSTEFAKGENTPTTFTVYLHSRDTIAPEILQEMTENIKKNGYSKNNEKSTIKAMRSDRDSLMSFFMNNAMNVIISKKSGQPTIMKLNGVVSTTYSDSSFKFNNDFAISTDTTKFTLEVTWRMIDAESGSAYDSSATTGFKIVRSSKVNQPSEGYLECWERDLILQYNGKPINAINETMNKLEVVFTTNSSRYKTVRVDITHKSGSSKDTLWNMPLTENDAGFSGFFDREIGTPKRDNILQHADPDSIILIYRNPDNPLDTIRKAYPFAISKILKFPAAYYYDKNADGKVDSIFIEVEGAVDQEDLEKLKSSITLPGPRKFKLNSISIAKGGIALDVTEQNNEIKTYVSPTDIIAVNSGSLPAGGLIEGNIINVQDRVAPVLMSGTFFSDKQDSLQVEFSEPVDHFSSKQPILFSHDGKTYSVYLAENGIFSKERFYTSKVSSVQSGFAITDGDLIWINPDAKIGDTLDVKQLNPENRKVPIRVREAEYDITVRTVNNPMKPDEPIPPKLVTVFEKNGQTVPKNGVTIVVEPKGDIKNKIKMKAKGFNVYDVVKHLVKKDVVGVFDDESQKLYFVWDGKNENKRKVGTGTYTAVIQIETISEKTNRTRTSVQKVPLGIKWK